MPQDNTFKTEENEKTIDIVKRIFKFNDKIQSRQGIEILTPNQMLSRLRISLLQLKVGNNSEKLKKRNEAIIVFVEIKKTYKKYL